MTSQPDNRCDPDLYSNGRTVCWMAGPSTVIEAMVVRAREELGVRLDWHYAGGRACILSICDDETAARIDAELRRLVPQFLSEPRTALGFRVVDDPITGEKLYTPLGEPCRQPPQHDQPEKREE